MSHALSKIPFIMNQLVMTMGGAATHPEPGDISKKPSVASVVGSSDSNTSQLGEN